jgi:hypothetical protein
VRRLVTLGLAALATLAVAAPALASDGREVIRTGSCSGANLRTGEVCRTAATI